MSVFAWKPYTHPHTHTHTIACMTKKGKKSATMRHSIIASSGKLIEIAERFATLLRAQRATDKPKWENMNFDAVPLPSKQRSGTFSSSARVPNPETCSVLFIISIIQQHTLCDSLFLTLWDLRFQLILFCCLRAIATSAVAVVVAAFFAQSQTKTNAHQPLLLWRELRCTHCT